MYSRVLPKFNNSSFMDNGKFNILSGLQVPEARYYFVLAINPTQKAN